MNKPRILQFLIVTVAAWGLGACQSPSAPSAPAHSGVDPHAQLEPESAPGEGQMLLARMAGDWNVVRKFYPRTGDPTITNGTCKQTMVLGSRFLRSDFIFHDPGGDTTGQGIIGFDADTGQFTSFWIDSRSTRISLRQSRETFDGKQIVLFAKSLTDSGPGARQSRTVSHLENNGRTLIHQQFGTNADGTERLVMELLMTKK
jgi:Protein of unknown function (DUF1579)